MEDCKFEIITHFTGVCKCCMQEGSFKSLWKEHLSDIDGEKEIYGVMLIECFGLPWLPPDSDDIEEQICDECIYMLHMAYNFKKKILTTQENLQEQFENACDEKEVKKEKDVRFNTDHDYEDVAYLEEDEEASAATTLPNSSEPSNNTEDSTMPDSTKKRAFRVYKKYGEVDMMHCMAAIKSGELTKKEASTKYNVPMKTIAAKLKRESDALEKAGSDEFDTPEQEGSYVHRLNSDMFRQDLTQIIRYTNAIPFRNNNVHIFCLYCKPVAKEKFFEDYEELKIHMRAVHEHNRVTDLIQAISPRWKNEIVKVDIENLHCIECNVPLREWDDLFLHMKIVHDIDLDEARKRVVPFVLKPTMKCVFCAKTYQNFHLLDTHMNCHYDNYICLKCGATFVAHGRLTKHMEKHDDLGKHPCEFCGKIFTRDLYRKKHVVNFHRRQMTVKCFYCDVKMCKETERQKHILLHHKDKVKIITCEYCGKTYNYQPNYIKHVRRTHREFTKLPPMPTETKKTMHLCTICNRKYSSVSSLKRHIVKEHSDEGIKILQVK